MSKTLFVPSPDFLDNIINTLSELIVHII